jgi:hypothetical protein
MSAFGTKQTSRHAQSMSAFGGKADIVRALTQSGHWLLAKLLPTLDSAPACIMECKSLVRRQSFTFQSKNLDRR